MVQEWRSGVMPWRVRDAVSGDETAIHALVCELARYEKEPDAVVSTPADFRAALFGDRPEAHCLVAEVQGESGLTVVGMAVWYVTFSTWRGRHGLWLEDLFVRPDVRGLGIGRALLEGLARICHDRGYPRLEWWVLDWNEAAHRFYRGLGAVPQEAWTVWRLDNEELRRLAESGPTESGPTGR
jgi:GNAT superfamily N-acetyltransferase